jgi:hypothetical protein
MEALWNAQSTCLEHNGPAALAAGTLVDIPPAAVHRIADTLT